MYVLDKFAFIPQNFYSGWSLTKPIFQNVFINRFQNIKIIFGQNFIFAQFNKSNLKNLKFAQGLIFSTFKAKKPWNKF